MAASEPTVVALTSGYYGVDGKSIHVVEGDTYRANDPVVKKFPDAFSRKADKVVIEQATAAPGEQRGGKVI